MAFLRLIAVVCAVVGLDQFTKKWVVNSFHLYESREIIPGFFNLTYLTNKGAAFGFLAGVDGAWRHYLFVTISVVALAILAWAWFRFRQSHPLYEAAMALIGGGAIGNLIDRVSLGSVVDFLDFSIGGRHWPAFNVADSAITVGVAIFILANILEERSASLNKQKKQ